MGSNPSTPTISCKLPGLTTRRDCELHDTCRAAGLQAPEEDKWQNIHRLDGMLRQDQETEIRPFYSKDREKAFGKGKSVDLGGRRIIKKS